MISDENILHYLWKYKLFLYQDLTSADGSSIDVLHCGNHNQDSGPDFANAKIRINETLWAGSVEIHIHSSDWARHNHQHDKSYDNVILHVVWDNDGDVFRTDGTVIPVLELKNIVDNQLLSKIDLLRKSEAWIPCESLFNTIDSLTVTQFLDRTLVERLEYKAAYIAEIYKKTKGSWEDTFYIILARNFGFNVNATPFEILAKSLPQHILAKHKHNPLQIESLVFGVAGFLESPYGDAYPQQLATEFNFLQKKYQLAPLDKHWWKSARIRPDNFPVIRLAQFSALVYKSSHLFSKLLEVEEVKAYRNLFKDLAVQPYWYTSYDFDKKRKSVSACNLGDSSIDVLLINAIAPMLFYYGNLLGIAHFKDKALNLLQALKPESNSVVNKFKDYGLTVASAFDSQGLIQMKKNYCDQKKCLNCAIGIKILKR